MTNDARMPIDTDLAGASTPALFELYRSILAELKTRGVIRTENAPAGDYAEHLVATAYGGELAPNSEKSWDVLCPDGTRLQVKARVVSDPPVRSQRQLSPFRTFHFDSAVIVLLNSSDYSVQRAAEIPRPVVEAAGVFQRHVNGYVVHATAALLDHPESIDVTQRLRGPELA